MKDKHPFVLSILKEFYNEGILNEIMLIGSWCLYFYKYYFDELKNLSLLRTKDIDFLIPYAKNIKKQYSIPEVLKKFHFRENFNSFDGLIKYSHPDLELEFLVNEIGRGSEKPVEIKQLNVNATAFRYLNILQDNIITINYEKIKIRLPEPSAYSLHKFIIFQRRLKEEKKEKDLRSAIEVGELAIENEYHKFKMKEIFNNFNKKLQKKIISTVSENSEKIHQLLT